MTTVVFTLRMICLLLMGFIIDQTLSEAKLIGNDNVNVISSSQWSDWAPERVIDHNDHNDADSCRCCSATNNEFDPWYQLDLGKYYRVQRVYIKGRRETRYGQHFQNLQIFFESIHAGMKNVEYTEARPVYDIDYILNVPKSTRSVSIILKNVTRYFIVCNLEVHGECADGEYGDTCNNVCHCKGNPCNKTTGVCPSGECLPGYHGQQCDKLCSDGKYGPGCKIPCGNCLGNNAVCDKMTGKCPSSCSEGYRGDQCKTECVAGSYGQNCTKKCGKCLDNKPCNVTTGSCENGCSAGYLGLLCDRECNKGRYGINCTQRCGNCKNDETCRFRSGTCPTGCRAGYQGNTCKTECNKGRYGIKCTQRCGNCKNDETCKFTSGTCPTGCRGGYQGNTCKTECTDGTYGDGCVSQCGRCYNDTVCDTKSGICTGCASGFNGVKCDVEETSSEKDSCFVPIGVSIGAILFIEAFVGAVVYIIWKRRQGQAERSSPQEVNIYEMPDREAFASEHPYELNQQSDTIIPTYENTLRSPTNE